MALMNMSSQSYGVSLDIWDHNLQPVTSKHTHP